MADANNTKKIVSIVSAASLVVALIVIGALVLLNRSGYSGPTDEDGNPLYPKASAVTRIEYLHRPALSEKKGLAIEERELTDEDGIETFLDTLEAAELRTPTDEERAALDYTGAVEMFTFKMKDGDDQTLLMMGDSISINNEYGNYFYMTDGIDLSALTGDFEETDLASQVVTAADDDAATAE